MTIDISDIAEKNHDYAVHLATLEDIISYKNGLFLINKFELKNPHKVVDLYRNIALSCELLLKASMLKHHVNFFKRREHCKYGEKVTAAKNEWMKQNLKDLNILHIAQINTGTVSTALKKAEEELFEKIGLPQEKIELISKMFYLIIRTKRNRNTHFYFPNMSKIDISEIEMIYLPLLNILESIYRANNL